MHADAIVPPGAALRTTRSPTAAMGIGCRVWRGRRQLAMRSARGMPRRIGRRSGAPPLVSYRRASGRLCAATTRSSCVPMDAR